MKVTVIPIVIGALGTVPTGTGGLGNKGTSGYNPNDREESWRLEETCCHWKSSERPPANTDVRNSQGVKIIIDKDEDSSSNK